MPTPRKNGSKPARVEVTSPRSEGFETKPAKGKLGVMIPGMGAVSTTFVAGVEAIRKGIAAPIGSMTWSSPVGIFSRTTCMPPPPMPACSKRIC